VPLLGALFNREESMSRLRDLKKRLLREAAKKPRSAIQKKPRPGEIQDAVIAVLGNSSPKPMRAKSILYAVEDLLGKSISRGTVDSCLSVGIKGAHPRFVRTKPGWYRLA
jgi:hypothetical protein